MFVGMPMGLFRGPATLVEFVNIGAISNGSSSWAPVCPTVTTGNILLYCLEHRDSPTHPVTTSPSGFTLLAQATGGSGSSGADSGICFVTVWYKISDGSESGTTVNSAATSGRTGQARIIQYKLRSGSTWDIASTTGSDNTSGPDWSVTMNTNPGVIAGDTVIAVSGQNTDVGIRTSNPAPSFTAPGVVFGFSSVRANGTTTFGDDSALNIVGANVHAGAATGVITFQAAALGEANIAGATVLVRLRPA